MCNQPLFADSQYVERRIDKFFDELVPSKGPAKDRSGEIIRAFSRIAYRFENDGDMLGKGYGRETCNPAGRYLREVLDAPARKIIALMWKEFDEDVYEIELDAL